MQLGGLLKYKVDFDLRSKIHIYFKSIIGRKCTWYNTYSTYKKQKTNKQKKQKQKQKQNKTKQNKTKQKNKKINKKHKNKNKAGFA